MTKPLTKEEKDERAKARLAKDVKTRTAKVASEKTTKAKKAKPAKGDAPAKPAKEIDVGALDVGKARKRLGAIYKLKKNLEKKQALFDLASRNRRAAKAELEEAQAELDREIEEQRVGPGPLFGANPETLPAGRGTTTDDEDEKNGEDEGEAA